MKSSGLSGPRKCPDWFGRCKVCVCRRATPRPRGRPASARDRADQTMRSHACTIDYIVRDMQNLTNNILLPTLRGAGGESGEPGGRRMARLATTPLAVRCRPQAAPKRASGMRGAWLDFHASATTRSREELMTTVGRPSGFRLNRRDLMRYTASAALIAGMGKYAMASTPVDISTVPQEQWTPDFLSSLAGTEEVDTAAECAKVVPLDYKWHLTYWYVGPDQSYTPLQPKYENEFREAFHQTYPNITVEKTNIDYNSIADKLRTAALGNAAPKCVLLLLLWGSEFASKGQLAEFKPEDVGFKTSDFWPKAVASTK